MNNSGRKDSSAYRPLIIWLSTGIPLAVGLLYLLPKPENITGELRTLLNTLPRFNAIINGSTALILAAGFIAIRSGRRSLHQRLMITALLLSVLFLISYIAYHLTSESTPYGGTGTGRYLYYFVLLSHIFLSVIIIPLVLITVVRALSLRFDRHRRIARYTLPLWIYVAVSGVVVYLMISPYYPFNL